MNGILHLRGWTMPRLTPEQVDGAVRGELALMQNGRPVSLRLTCAELEAYDLAEKRGFVVAPQGSRLATAWFYLCDACGRPYVRIAWRGQRFAEVWLDLNTTDYRLTTEARREVMERIMAASTPAGYAEVSDGLTCRGSKVRRVAAEPLAAHLYVLASADSKHISRWRAEIEPDVVVRAAG